MFKKGYIPKSFMGIKPNEFGEGRIAYWWGLPPTILAQLRKDTPQVRVGAAPVLLGKRRMSYSTIGSFGMFSTTRHPEETMLWLRFLTRPENMRKHCSLIYRIAPKQSVGAMYAGDPDLALFEEQARYCRPDVKNKNIREIMRILGPEIQATVLGIKTPEQALKDAAVVANRLLESGK